MASTAPNYTGELMLEPTPKAPTAALVPVQERTVLFYGDNIPVAQAADGELYVPLRPLTDFLGLDASAQRRRVARNRILQRRARDVSFTAADGKRYAMLALPLELLPGWLFDIDLN